MRLKKVHVLLATMSMLAAVLCAGDGVASTNCLDNVAILNFNDKIEIRLFFNRRPSYREVLHTNEKIEIEILDAVTEAPRRYQLASAFAKSVSIVNASSAQGRAARINVELTRPVSYSAEVEDDRVLVLYLPGKSAPVEKPAPFSSPIIIDLHNDTITRVHHAGSLDHFLNKDLHVALPHLENSGVSALVFAVWVPTGEGFAYADSVIDTFYRFLDHYSDRLAFAGSAAEFESNLAGGKVTAFLSIEGGEAIEDQLDRVDYFYARGVRSIELMWNNQNLLGDSARDPKVHNGLSPFGRAVVRRMNHLGMIVDVSHASDAAAAEMIELSTDPVIASHSCCRSLRDHYRNLNDDLVKGICGKGGVIGVIFNTHFLTDRKKADVRVVADHIDHIVALGGVECVALGSDYDGGIRPAAGLENISRLGNLSAELSRRGYSTEDINKMFGWNFIRVFRQVVDAKIARPVSRDSGNRTGSQ